MGAAHQRFNGLSEPDLELLRERTLEVSPQSQTTDGREMIELLEIQSHGQSFVLPLSALQGIAELTSIAPIPRAPPSVRGIVSFRGELLVGVELSTLVGELSSGIVDLRRIIAVMSQTMKLAILGEKVLSVRIVPRDLFRPAPSKFGFVVGTDENFVSLLDPALLIEHVLQLLGRTHE